MSSPASDLRFPELREGTGTGEADLDAGGDGGNEGGSGEGIVFKSWIVYPIRPEPQCRIESETNR